MIVEILVALSYRIKKILELRDMDVCGRAEFICPLIEPCGIVHPQRAIGTKSWEHSSRRPATLDSLVIFERLSRIIRRTYGNYAELLQNALRAEFLFREVLIGSLPDVFGRVLVEQ